MSRSRPRNDVVTPSSTGRVATSIPCRDLLSVPPKQPRSRPQTGSRHRFSCPARARSRHQKQVATLPGTNLCRDIAFMSRHRFHVATSISCRDLVSTHSGISRSRRQTPGRDLPHCYPCRDLKNDVATSTQLSPISATSRRHLSMSRPPLLPPMS